MGEVDNLRIAGEKVTDFAAVINRGTRERKESWNHQGESKFH
jgi:hypothetical protein